MLPCLLYAERTLQLLQPLHHEEVQAIPHHSFIVSALAERVDHAPDDCIQRFLRDHFELLERIPGFGTHAYRRLAHVYTNIRVYALPYMFCHIPL
jgi:hypothetical protein